ncbi:hypothetical protein M8C21_033145 [Ambrosia artemisiifolia]|uniref:Uncharacterized protein n=1 Tax=Ambrosia artemisiifolia TaxID=4212 RepID=A0AAD5DGD5_AMBAR|nr:hypothetical protein M8C21_033145 [Ambrosia artemisiifolia]
MIDKGNKTFQPLQTVAYGPSRKLWYKQQPGTSPANHNLRLFGRRL